MELKFFSFFDTSSKCSVLIIPYGIEIKDNGRKQDNHYTVLIIPYGIEMQKLWLGNNACQVLIIPYGIEICSALHSRSDGTLF